MRHALHRFLHWLLLDCRVWLFWSRLVRLCLRPRFRRLAGPLPRLSLEEAQADMSLVGWASDSGRILWDAIGPAERFRYLVLVARAGAWTSGGPMPVGRDNDCDDFAAYGVACVRRAVLLQVSWSEGWRVRGHVVALLWRPDGWYHFGNWGTFGPFWSVREVVRNILKGRELVGWAIISDNLRLLGSGRSLDRAGAVGDSIRQRDLKP